MTFEIAQQCRHVAVIPDGNRRWASQRGMTSGAGHAEGARRAVSLAGWCRDWKISHLTLFLMSRTNFDRPSEELVPLLEAVEDVFDQLSLVAVTGLRTIGNLGLLPSPSRRRIEAAVALSSACPDLNVNLAVGYDSDEEMRHAMNHALANGKDLRSSLDLAGQPGIDFVIRTSGERRLSGFLPLQTAAAELHFTDTLWPDFGKLDFDLAMKDFSSRQRRYGL
ncbi:polyprenyl diphosphate synthase [Streptomyces sp. NPDC033538]|uniref:polyprenyl diphosphate synthase n=1 Tax=Streptomyces sp. NPDC033538 TaxID=3155367 RepID=UPI0033E490BF